MSTINNIINTVRELAEERPDYVYRKPDGASLCRYMDDVDTPGCIFGHALWRLGLIDNRILDTDLNEEGINAVFEDLGIPYSVEASIWCQDVQNLQDGGRSWGAAVAHTTERIIHG